MFRLLDTCETKFNGWLADVGWKVPKKGH